MESGWPEAERSLTRKLRSGDIAAVEPLMDHYGEDLLRYIHSIVGNVALAEDVFQDTWVAVMEKGSSFRETLPFAPWLFRIARNRAYDALRQRSTREVSLGEETSCQSPIQPDARTDFAEEYHRHEVVGALLPRLDPDHREILWLRYFHDESYEELSQLLRIPMGTVKSRLKRALDRLGRLYVELMGGSRGSLQRSA